MILLHVWMRLSCLTALCVTGGCYLVRSNETRRARKSEKNQKKIFVRVRFVKVNVEVTKDYQRCFILWESQQQHVSLFQEVAQLTWRTDGDQINLSRISNSNGMIFKGGVSAERRERSEFPGVENE